MFLGYKYYQSNSLKNIPMKDYIEKVIIAYDQNTKFLNDLDPNTVNYLSTGSF